jgi:hypothetical protein
MSAQNQSALMDVDEAQIDEGLYSRQLQVSSSVSCHFAHRRSFFLIRYVLGHEGVQYDVDKGHLPTRNRQP